MRQLTRIGPHASAEPSSYSARAYSSADPGTIDADYRGEVKVPLINLGRQPFTVERGMRVAQMVIARLPDVRVEEVAELDATGRGAGGFGHTGQ